MCFNKPVLLMSVVFHFIRITLVLYSARRKMNIIKPVLLMSVVFSSFYQYYTRTLFGTRTLFEYY